MSYSRNDRSAEAEGHAGLRASDADRERTAAALRRHHVDGRLDTDELQDRLGRCYAARTEDDLRALLADLPPDQRDVLLLRVVADLSIEDTAAALGKRPGAVKSLQHRAMASLRRTLGDEGGVSR